MLYTTTSPTAAGSRALVTGWFHARSGEQVASISQEDVVLAYPHRDTAASAHRGTGRGAGRATFGRRRGTR